MRIRLKILMSIVLFLVCHLSLDAQNKRLLSGSVIDAATKEPLPYVTVSLKKQLIGIVTNEEGKFDLYIPEEVVEDTLFVNYLGYKHVLIDIASIKEPIIIKLEETVVQLEEIVIRPLLPQNYIQMAMRKIKENYPKDPFQTEAYYREKLLENKNLVKCDEGVFTTYYPSYIDTIPAQNQLMLFRRADSIRPIAFMNSNKKKGEGKDSTNENGRQIDLGGSFGGPSEILKVGDISKKPEAFLDSTQFKSYRYSFAKSSSYNTDELMVIDFETRGKVNHVREKGKVYIDLKSLAIVKIECKGDFIIPAIIKPVFFFMSIGIKNPTYEKKSEFQEINGKWYPKNIQNTIDIKLSNKHLFKKDEYGDFEIEQFFTVNEFKTDSITEIPLAKRFIAGKDMEKQVYNDTGLTWEGLNIIKK